MFSNMEVFLKLENVNIAIDKHVRMFAFFLKTDFIPLDFSGRIHPVSHYHAMFCILHMQKTWLGAKWPAKAVHITPTVLLIRR